VVVYLLSTDYSSLVLDPLGNVDHLVDLYDSTLRDIVDEHAPLRTKEMPRRTMLPQYNKNIQTVKKHRRYCDRLWVRTSLCVHYEIFKVSKILVKIFLPLLNLSIMIKDQSIQGKSKYCFQCCE